MPVTFANPLLLAGLASIAIPLLLHLIIREERSGQAFPSLMFIRRTPYEVRRRRTLRDRVLLALRCLALALLVLAFAGPELTREPDAGPVTDWSKDTILLLDRSASMSAPERWQAALAAAAQRVDQLAAGERMAIVAFDDSASLIAPLRADRNLLRSHLTRLQAGPRGTQLGAAFDLAARVLRESPASEQHILLISDLQQSALARVDRLILDPRVALEVLIADTPVDRNATIMAVSLSQPSSEEHALSIRLRNTGSEAFSDINIAVEVEGRIIEQRSIGLAPRAEHTLLVPVVLAPDRAVSGRVVLGKDKMMADNVHHLVLMPDAPLELVLLLEANLTSVSAGPRPFVEQAARLASYPPIEVTPVARDMDLDDSLQRADIVIAQASSVADRARAAGLLAFVEGGGGLMILMDDPPADRDRKFSAQNFDDSDFLRGLGELRRFPDNGTGIRLTPDSREHRIWRGFADDIGLALAGTRIRMARDFDSARAAHPSRVLARLSDGAPWLIEQTFGRGRLLLATTGLGSGWGNLALEPGFVPLLHAILRDLGRRPPFVIAHTQRQVVDLGPLAANLPGASNWDEYLASGGALVVELPGGGQRQLASAERLYQPPNNGLYQVHRADGRPPPLLLAVNPEPAESLLTAASQAELESRITRRPLSKAVTYPARDAAGIDPGPPLAWYLLGFAAILLWLEAQLANWLSKRRLESPKARLTGATPVEDGGG